MGKHLTLEDRITIQKLLKEGKSYAEIAAELSRPASTISREVKNTGLLLAGKRSQPYKPRMNAKSVSAVTVNARSLHVKQYTKRIANTAEDAMIFVMSLRKRYVQDIILRHTFVIVARRNHDVHFPSTYMMPKKLTKNTKTCCQPQFTCFQL